MGDANVNGRVTQLPSCVVIAAPSPPLVPETHWKNNKQSRQWAQVGTLFDPCPCGVGSLLLLEPDKIKVKLANWSDRTLEDIFV